MGSENTLTVIAVTVIIVSLITAAFITLESRQDSRESPPVTSPDTGEKQTVSSEKMRILWFDDEGHRYTFHDYDLPGPVDPATFDPAAIPTPDPASPFRQAGMIRFLTWDGTMERMTGLKYLVSQDRITGILNRYTLVGNTPLPDITPAPVREHEEEIEYPAPEPGMLIPLIGPTCARPDRTQETSFGYVNRHDHPVRLPVGEQNRFTPGDLNRGQPEVFKPGIYRDLFSIRYPSNSTNLIWYLNGAQVAAGVVSPVRPVFVADPAGGYAPLEIRFTDRSSGSTPDNPLTGSWDLGDGTTGAGTIITHRYEHPGTYQVTRTIGNQCEQGSMTMNITVHPAEFIWKPSVGDRNMILFTPESGGDPSIWFWDFSDGNTSWEEKPVHSFPGPGLYPVGLSITGQAGSGRVVHTVQIT